MRKQNFNTPRIGIGRNVRFILAFFPHQNSRRFEPFEKNWHLSTFTRERISFPLTYQFRCIFRNVNADFGISFLIIRTVGRLLLVRHLIFL